MNKYNSFFLGISFCCCILLLQSCQKVIDPKDLPQQDPMLVVNSVISNDTIIQATISSSKSILSGKAYKMLDNAYCDLYENDVFIETLSNKKNGIYESKSVAKTNKKYTLKVACSGYNSVEGSSSVPNPIKSLTAEVYDTLNPFFYSEEPNPNGVGWYYYGGTVKFKITIKDEKDIKNYYNLYPVISFLDSNNIEYSNIIRAFMDLNSSNSTSGVTQSYISNLDIDDKDYTDGGDIILNISIFLNTSVNLIPPGETIIVYLKGSQLNEDLYKYRQTLSQQASGSSTNIFTEPTLVHNNIKNGMGIVGALNSTAFKIYEAKLIHK